MKVTDNDRALAARFPEKETEKGFGRSQADAGVSTESMKRLLALGLIKMTSRGIGMCGVDPKGWHRWNTHFVKARIDWHKS